MIEATILYFVIKAVFGFVSGGDNSYRKYDDEEWMRWNYENR